MNNLNNQGDNGGISPNPSDKISRFLQNRRKANISARAVNLACENFFRSRGMPVKESFNERLRSRPTDHSHEG
jgi:hypothetical protein